jgi:hypothetical protein
MSYSYNIARDLTFANLGEFIRPILQAYQLGEIDRGHLTEWSNVIQDYLWGKYGNPETMEPYGDFPDDDYRSIGIEVCCWMYDLEKDGLIMLPSDVPHFLEFLNTPRGQELEGWKKIRKYIARLKVEERIPEEEKQGFFRSVAALNAKNENES